MRSSQDFFPDDSEIEKIRAKAVLIGLRPVSISRFYSTFAEKSL